MKTIRSLVLTASLAFFLIAINHTGFAYSCGLSTAEMKRLSVLHWAGLNGDVSQAEALRDVVRNADATSTKTFSPSMDEPLVMTALRSLTRLHATSAIADIDALRQKDKQKYPSISNFAAVQEARLKAEQEAGPRNQISAFYSALGMTPTDITAGMESYRKQYYASAEGRRLPLPVAVYAMRELADMAYQSQSLEAVSLVGASAIDFSKDYPSALKMRLAPLPRAARITSLLDSLTSVKVLGTDEDYLMQLLADEGLAAVPAVAAQLAVMDAHRDQYPQNGFVALFQVLESIPDKSQSQLLEKFTHDTNGGIAHYAQPAYYNVSRGIVRVHAVGY